MLPATGSTITQAISPGFHPHDGFHRGQIAGRERDGFGGNIRGDSRLSGEVESGDSGAGLREEVIGVAVVAALRT